MNLKKLFQPTLIKISLTVFLQIIQFVGLAGCFGGGYLLCSLNPMVWIFQSFTLVVPSLSPSFPVFPVILIVSLGITYTIICIFARIIKKVQSQ